MDPFVFVSVLIEYLEYYYGCSKDNISLFTHLYGKLTCMVTHLYGKHTYNNGFDTCMVCTLGNNNNS